VHKSVEGTWRSRELIVYFALAYGLSALLWLPLIARSHAPRFAFSVGTFGPTLAALISQRAYAGNWRAFRLWTSTRQVALGTAWGTSLVLFSSFAAALFMTRSGFNRWQWSSLLGLLIFFGPNLIGGPLGEEPGWRGYALPRLQQRFGPGMASLLLGFLWANWHLPLIAAHIYNVTWWQFVLVTTAASVLLTFAFNISQGSVVCAILVHGVYNIATGIILNDFIGKATLYSNRVQHNVYWMAYCGVAAALWLATRGRLGLKRDQGTYVSDSALKSASSESQATT